VLDQSNIIDLILAGLINCFRRYQPSRTLADLYPAPKKASNIFHNIMQASVKGNPKPELKRKQLKRNEQKRVYLSYLQFCTLFFSVCNIGCF
jgi:hypothetical protein